MRLDDRDPRMQLRAAGRRLLDEDRVTGQPLGQRGEDVPGAQRLALGRRRGRGRRDARGVTAPASAAQIAAGSPSTASAAGPRCASAGSWVTTTNRVPGSTSGPSS
jgi:hypothetical protein